MSSTVILKAAGLNTSPNELSVPEGSLSEATNVLIRRDGIVEQRRGFKLYGTPAATALDRVKQLTVYRARIIRHITDKLQFDSDGQGNFQSFVGSYLEADPSLRMKFIEANGNLYFTSSNGIQKLSAKTTDTLQNSTIVNAGAVKALDIIASVNNVANLQTGFLPQDSAVAYRIVWGYKDANGNLILGAPSQREIIYVYQINLMLQDFMRFIGVLDSFTNIPLTTARINDKNYVSTLGLTSGASTSDLHNNLISLATKLDNDILYANASGAPLIIADTLTTLVSTTAVLTSGTTYRMTFTTDPTPLLAIGSHVVVAGMVGVPAFTGDINGTQIVIGTNVTGVSPYYIDYVATSTPAASGTWNSTAATITIPAVTITSGTCTINFTGAVVTDYLNITDHIFLSGFTPLTPGTLNGAQVITGATTTSISFNASYLVGAVPTPVQGPVTVSTPIITSNTFRAIIQPPAVQIPPVHIDNMDTQAYMLSILAALRALPLSVISASDQLLLDVVNITTTVNLDLAVTIPQNINSSYFYQIYRSAIFSASNNVSINDVIPNDELQLVYEAFPTAAQIAAGTLGVIDLTPAAFAGANLYTNNSTGEGILQANEIPPYALDINRYKNVVFYANTRTKHKTLLSLLGVQNMIAEYNAGTIPSITISTSAGANTYTFVTGLQEKTNITTVADVANSLNDKYFLIDSATGLKYYFYFKTTGSTASQTLGTITGIGTTFTASMVGSNFTFANGVSAGLITAYSSPTSITVNTSQTVLAQDYVISPVGTRIGVKVEIPTGATAAQIMAAIKDRFSVLLLDYTSSNATYSTGVASQTLTTITGVGTAFDATMVGSTFVFANGVSAGTIISYASPTSITVSTSQSVSSQVFIITFPNKLTVTNVDFGPISAAVDFNTGFTISVIQAGRGEDIANKTVLLSTNVSPSIAVDETARSLIRVINSNTNESVYGFYLSGAFDVPGKMEIEARTLAALNQFFITANNSVTGASFNPNITPDVLITSITTGTNPIITTATAHGLLNLDFAVIGNTNSTPNVDGVYAITYIDATHFSISHPVAVTVAGTLGSMSRAVDVLTSENETKPNRIYYSKLNQPEAVPISNFFDVGAQDKAILRIMPLRNSLFVFKEDGLFRISGETAPFQLSLFDSSFTVTAPDSVTVSNNIIYAWTNQGIQNLTEGGAGTVSRAIDNEVLKLGSNNYTHFKTATWGVGYESDNSYIVWTVSTFDDVIATKAYRYSTLTRTWTTYDKTNTCGIVSIADDVLYLGAGDTNYTEQERKLFDRTDFADRELYFELANTFLVNPTELKMLSVTGVAVGDVIVQDQTVTTFLFNTLLNKLDSDPSIAQKNFFATLELKAGDNPRDRLIALATKLDADANIVASNFLASINDFTGTFTAISGANPTIITATAHGLITGRNILISGSNSTPVIDGTYTVTVIDANHFSIPVSVKIPGTTAIWQTVGLDTIDLQTSFNKIADILNADVGVSFNNYSHILNNTIQESIITDINIISKHVIVNLPLQYLVGDILIYKAIHSSITYSPISMGDPLSLKHLRESTLMFQTKNLTSATLSFATDLLPELIPVPFQMDGNGIFGHSNFGTGFFGGAGNSAPFRTFVPRQCQRCRFVVLKYEHSIAREDYRLLGASITGEVGQSTRAYR